jgi:adenosylcobinamide-GDP ribazoletransferase
MTYFLPKAISWVVFVITLSLLYLFKWYGLVVLISFLLLLFYLRSLFIKRIGGITGDTIGASIELIEMNVLIAFVVAYFYIA